MQSPQAYQSPQAPRDYQSPQAPRDYQSPQAPGDYQSPQRQPIQRKCAKSALVKVQLRRWKWNDFGERWDLIGSKPESCLFLLDSAQKESLLEYFSLTKARDFLHVLPQELAGLQHDRAFEIENEGFLHPQLEIGTLLRLLRGRTLQLNLRESGK